jgi:hypothetical protein
MSTSNVAAPRGVADDNTLDYVRRLASAGFYGEVTLKFLHGSIVHVLRNESFKPNELQPGSRRTYADINSNR